MNFREIAHLMSTESPTGSLKATDKITILLKEYDTLRAEMIARINSRFAFLGLTMGIVALVWSRDRAPSTMVMLGLAATLLVVWFYLGQLLYRLRVAIAHVENEINKLAGTQLLTWESHRSSRLLSHVHGLFAKKRNKNTAGNKDSSA